MNENPHALFLSYASQDAAAAQRIADGLRAAGIEVWFDQSELRGGDAWDALIRKRLKSCALFVPVVSKTTEARAEGYFRLEWKLAVDRSHLMAEDRAFIVPVVIDDTNQATARVPEAFRARQWTRLPGGAVTPEFVRQIAQLMGQSLDNPVPSSQPAASPIRADQPNAIASTSTSGRGLPWRVLGVVGALLTLLLVVIFTRGVNVDVSNDSFSNRSADSKSAPASIAVLPFADLSATRDQEYLGDGLAEEILNQLAQVPSLRLVGRTSSFSFKGKNEDLRVIGQKLSVANLLEGSVRKDGNQLRVTAQLIRTNDGTHLWSKTYARELKDVFAVQDEIAKDVATALSVKLEAGVLTRAAGGTKNVEAYEKLLRAREVHAKGGRDNAAKSVQFLREAVELDPDFGAAWVARVWVLYQMGRSSEAIIAASREIEDIVARNVRSAPAAPWTQQLQGQDHLSHYRWMEAAAALKAVQATPYGARRTVDAFTNPPIYLNWSSLHSTGRLREGAQMGDDWVRVDPLSSEASGARIMWLMYVGRDEEATAEYARAKSLGIASEWPMLTRLLRSENIDLAALKARFVAIGADKDKADSLNRQIFDNLGKPDALRAVLQRALEAPPASEETMGNVAIFADAFGERDLALAAIRKDALSPVARNPHRIGSRLWYPYKTKLRTDPRFKEIAREIGLVDYWKKTGNWGDFCKPAGNDDFECR